MATTLIVTEKPDAALHVAEALGENGSPKRIVVDGVPFFEVQGNDRRILVCSALGHLYAVAAKERQSQARYPVWDFTWKPKHLVQRGQERQKKWIQAISKVSRDADRFIDACDFDLEGSLIGYMVLKYACRGAEKKAQRMKFSTLTEAELRGAYVNALPKLNFPLVHAGMCRHEVDWLFGINLSRALTESALKASGRYETLSTGRVQGPTLRFLVERQQQMETFVPTPYWILKVKLEVDGRIVAADYEEDRLERRTDAQEVIRACARESGIIENLESIEYDLAPPTPFDLSSLQSEAFRHFGLSPHASLGIAERLYLDQLISYPRTSSQKLPPSIGYENIVKNLGRMEPYRADSAKLLAPGKLIPYQGRKDDPAHPAVYPTGTLPKQRLAAPEQKLYDLVVRRFLASFGPTAIKRIDKATINVANHHFLLRGTRLVEKGWTTIYRPYAKFEDVSLPPLKVGQSVLVNEIKTEQRFTQPPPHYNPSSLLRKMEASGIGTKATRADIIDILYKRGYITGQQITSTPLASRIVEILLRHCPKVVDVTFTRDLESKIEEIELGSETREQVVSETVEYLKPIIESLKLREREIGEELATILSETRNGLTTLFTPCPKCGSALKVAKNPRTRKRFIGCSGRWRNNCDYSLPLPQIGALTLLHKQCTDCGFQLIQVKSKGRRSLVSCCRCYAQKVKQGSARQTPAVMNRA